MLPAPLGWIPTICCFSFVPALKVISPGPGLSVSQLSWFEDWLSFLSPASEEEAPKSKLPRGLIFVLVSMRPCSRIDRQSNILGAGFRVEVNARALRALAAR